MGPTPAHFPSCRAKPRPSRRLGQGGAGGGLDRWRRRLEFGVSCLHSSWRARALSRRRKGVDPSGLVVVRECVPPVSRSGVDGLGWGAWSAGTPSTEPPTVNPSPADRRIPVSGEDALRNALRRSPATTPSTGSRLAGNTTPRTLTPFIRPLSPQRNRRTSTACPERE